MPAILERCVKDLIAKGKSSSQAYAMCTASLQKAGKLKKGTQKAAPKSKKKSRAKRRS
jgi:hypothetical protein